VVQALYTDDLHLSFCNRVIEEFAMSTYFQDEQGILYSSNDFLYFYCTILPLHHACLQLSLLQPSRFDATRDYWAAVRSVVEPHPHLPISTCGKERKP
jgi:hypothetical protein